MHARLAHWLHDRLVAWMHRETGPWRHGGSALSRHAALLRPGDVLLVESRTRLGRFIKTATRSPWTHVALYAGHLHAHPDPELRRLHARHAPDLRGPLIVEAELGIGTRLMPLAKYDANHVRICRPRGLSEAQRAAVLRHALRRLGLDYDLRHLWDLARLLHPWFLLPRRLGSSLARPERTAAPQTICSTLIAEAFASVGLTVHSHAALVHGVLPGQRPDDPRLITPGDFDLSPHFDIIKPPCAPEWRPRPAPARPAWLAALAAELRRLPPRARGWGRSLMQSFAHR